MANIGHVQYQKGNQSGELKAVWTHDDYGCGTGLATDITTGEPNSTFAGNYQIQYFDNEGSLQAELDLEIQKRNGCFALTWRKNGAITSIGIGIETANVLSAGYYDV